MFSQEPEATPPVSTRWVCRLRDDLRLLALRLKEEVARLVAEAVADAVLDSLRRLLGAEAAEPRDFRHDLPGPEVEEAAWQEPLWQEDVPQAPTPPRPAAGRRWQDALGAAAEAGLWWLGRRPSRRPWLTAAAVALAAGGVAFVAGPAFGAAAGVLVSTAGLLLTAGPAGRADERLADLLTS
jgi:hypothetical protein